MGEMTTKGEQAGRWRGGAEAGGTLECDGLK